MDVNKRYQGYKRLSEKGSSRRASLGDVLGMGGLAPAVKVVDIMDTQFAKLCYTY